TSVTGSKKSDLAELIEDITDSQGEVVLCKLTESCPDQAHYWNHLGRHYIYRSNRDYKKAEDCLKRAILISKNDALHHHTLGQVRRLWIERKIENLAHR